MSRNDLKKIAENTLDIIEMGGYLIGDKSVEIASDIEAAVKGTQLFVPGRLQKLLEKSRSPQYDTCIEVTDQKTQDEVIRHRFEAESIALLNFASATRPGGGFRNGARAQEEDLARCSALYPCIAGSDFYKINKGKSPIYTDFVIWSPRVPFIKDSRYLLLEQPVLASVITAPAPNVSAMKVVNLSIIESVLRRRSGMILALAAEQKCDVLILGAWGCGVFQNDPRTVAESFKYWLNGKFAGVFRKVVFAVYDPSLDLVNFKPFLECFTQKG